MPNAYYIALLDKIQIAVHGLARLAAKFSYQLVYNPYGVHQTRTTNSKTRRAIATRYKQVYSSLPALWLIAEVGFCTQPAILYRYFSSVETMRMQIPAEAFPTRLLGKKSYSKQFYCSRELRSVPPVALTHYKK